MYTGPNPFNRIEQERLYEERRQQAEAQEREELRRDFHIPLPGCFIVVLSTIILLIVAGIVLIYGFHVW